MRKKRRTSKKGRISTESHTIKLNYAQHLQNSLYCIEQATIFDPIDKYEGFPGHTSSRRPIFMMSGD